MFGPAIIRDIKLELIIKRLDDGTFSAFVSLDESGDQVCGTGCSASDLREAEAFAYSAALESLMRCSVASPFGDNFCGHKSCELAHLRRLDDKLYAMMATYDGCDSYSLERRTILMNAREVIADEICLV